MFPHGSYVWYRDCMSGIHNVLVGDRGRIVVPVEVRSRAGLSEGTPMVLIESSDGLVLLTREQLRERVRRDVEGLSLVEDLLVERRQAAASEDAA